MHLSPFLVTEQDLGGLVGDEIREGLDQEWESRFKVNAICGEDYVVFAWDGRWEWATPGMRKKITEGYHDDGHSHPHEPEEGQKEGSTSSVPLLSQLMRES